MQALSSEAGLQAMIEGIQAAGLGQGTWLEALEGVGIMTGSRRAQLIGFTSSGAVTFNWVTATDPQAFVELEEAGCNDARVNSRLRVGIEGPAGAHQRRLSTGQARQTGAFIRSAKPQLTALGGRPRRGWTGCSCVASAGLRPAALAL